MLQIISPPAFSPIWAASISMTQILLTLSSFSTQQSSTQATSYSKFAYNKKLNIPVSSKLGMLMIYSPAFIWLLTKTSNMNIDIVSLQQRESILTLCLVGHFGKRIFETLFIHKYSGSSDGLADFFIGFYYLIMSWIIIYFLKFNENNILLSSKMLFGGISCYIIGEIGNFYHHLLLAQLRKSNYEITSNTETGQEDLKKVYKIPTGGLFPYISTPHYLFELIAWFGIALISQHMNAFLVFTMMSSYLGGRSKATSEWYRSNIPNYPKDRKNILPGFF